MEKQIMKKIWQFTMTTMGALILMNGSSPSAYAVSAGSIDPTRLPTTLWRDTQWVDPGSWTTINVNTAGLPANNSSIDASPFIANLIATNSASNKRLYFPAGTYYFKSSLIIHANNIWIDGDGRIATILDISASGSANVQLGFSGNSADGSPITVTGDVPVGATTITVTDASTLVVGDIIQLYAATPPLTNNGVAFGDRIYAQNFQITAIAGNVLTLDLPTLLSDHSGFNPMVQRFRAVQGCRVSHLRIHRDNECTAQGIANLRFTTAYNCYVAQIESSYSSREHVAFENSKSCVVESNFCHFTFQPTVNGYGYGISLTASTGCRVSANKCAYLRHNIILSQGANFNVISYNSIENPTDYNDLALHASYAYMNLMEGNMFKEGYADTSKDGWTTVEPTTGPKNMWFRNYATGQVGCIQSHTSLQNVIANNVGSLDTAGSDHYMGANNVSGTVTWGVFDSTSTFPVSLYTTNKPLSLGSVAWPVFGPDVSNWGTNNVLPCRSAILVP
jgi:hypothetical protein